MGKFSDWLNEAKKKEAKESSPPTATSSPIRGANQDQTGENDKNNTAAYTISDSKTIDNWELNSPSARKKAVKELMKLNSRHSAVEMPHEKIKESIISGVGKTRIQPVNQADNTPRKGSSGTSKKITSGLQNAANRRVTELDAAAQQEKENAKKERLAQVKQRNMQAQQRQREAEQSKQRSASTSVKEETLDEARGRPKKAAGEESTNIIMQLRKVITLRGQEPVTFANGARVKLNPSTAHRLLAMYDNLRTSGEKYSFSQRVHKSPDGLRDVLSGKKEVKKPKISLAGRITGTQNADHS